MAYRPGKARIALFFAVLAGMIALAFGWALGGAYSETFPRPFNAAQWKAASTYDKTRCGMIVDLQYRIGLAGKTREEVVQLLGSPEDRYNDPSYSHWHLCPSVMDIWVIEVQWKDGRVVSARVRDT
ncbi:hypothetical protein [Sphingomonas sp. G-3-2-10]|uniref:hypothetical protein n=1 Tax=Sphingomonas sp. G-3-2-10 TaxID=2728838 RepID=UPI00146F5385|nr:hypothetical protein [Sphingomonas sp. G-3-2-10]NML05203.1 hypothetical protein [Sphingomonas sp. G-3-2-10]